MYNSNRASEFFNQEVEWNSSIFFPDGYEELLLLIYFIFLPYISGIIFIFIVIARGRPALFSLIMTNHHFLLTWAIGYEVIAITTLLIIFKKAISFIFGKDKEENNHIRHHIY